MDLWKVLLFAVIVSKSRGARLNREFQPKEHENCNGAYPIQLFTKYPTSCVNILELTAFLNVSEELTGELVLSSEVSRCSLDMKTCEQYSKRNFRDFCNKYMTNNLLFSPVFGNVEPPLSCPVKPGNYTLKPTSLDLSIFSAFPVDGFVYVGKFQLTTGTTKRRTALCFQSETKVTKTRKPKGCT